MKAALILLWEQWRSMRVGIGLIALFLAAYALVWLWIGQLIVYLFAGNDQIMFGVAYLAAFGVLALSSLHESRHQLSFGFPRRMFALPVHTGTIIAVRFVYKIAVVGLAAAAAGWVCARFIDGVWSPVPGILLFVGLALAIETVTIFICAYGPGTGTIKFVPVLAVSSGGFYVLVQALGRNLAGGEPRPNEISPVDFAGAAGPIRRANPGISGDDLTEAVVAALARVPEIGWAPWWGGLAIIVFFGGVSYWALRGARSEIADDRVGEMYRRIPFRADASADRIHGSAMAAQRWLEWRRLTLWLPWVTSIVTLLLTLGIYRSLAEQESRAVVAVSCLLMGPAITAAVFGYLMTRTDRKYLFFVAGRPMNSAMLGRAKLWAGMRAVAVSYALMFFLYIVLMFGLFGETNFLYALTLDVALLADKGGASVAELLPITVASLVVAVAVTWSLLWLGRAVGVMVWLAGAAAMIGFRLDTRLTYQFGEDVWPPVVVIFVSAMALLLAVGCALAFAFSARKGFVSAKGLVIAAAIVGVLIVLTMPLRSWIGVDTPLVFVLYTLPLLPLIALPATIEWQRHRT